MQMLLAAAKPWTYWLAPPLLIGTIVLIVVLHVGYYRKVVVPAHLWRLEDQKRRRDPEATADVRPLRRTPTTSTQPMAA